MNQMANNKNRKKNVGDNECSVNNEMLRGRKTEGKRETSFANRRIKIPIVYTVSTHIYIYIFLF